MSRGATGSPGRPEGGGVWGAISGPPILIGLDVGGTTIAAGAVTPDGEVLLDERVATRDAKAVGTLAAIEALVERVRAAVAARGLTVAGIGVGVPGPVDAEAGVVGDPAPHAPDLVDVPLAQRLAARFGIPAFVDNAVHALALGGGRAGRARRACGRPGARRRGSRPSSCSGWPRTASPSRRRWWTRHAARSAPCSRRS